MKPMTPHPAAEEIETLIRARYPLIYVVSSEEARVQQALAAIAARRQKRLYEWSCTTGLAPAGTSIQLQKQRASPTRDPLAAMDQVIDQVDPAIFCFKDFHPYLARGQHAVIRKLKEIAQHLKNSLKSIVLISPVAEVPPELEKEITLINYPLPDRNELDALLSSILAELGDTRQVKIDLDTGARNRLLQAALGLTLAEAENVFARIVVKNQRLSGDDVAEVLAEKRQIIRKSGLLEYFTAETGFSGVGGLDGLKGWLQKRASAFTEEARQFGLPAPKGILLLGVQGCGKSLCAKAISRQWELPLLRFDIGRMFGSLVGSSEENIRRAMQVAESVSPAILWVDEIDKAFAGAQSSGVSDAGTSARVFGTFLTWLSEKTAPVFVVATANEISHLPAELMRRGRFDEIFFVDLPVLEERSEIFRIHLGRRRRDPETFDLERLAAATDGFSGAEIEQTVISALYDAFAEGRDLRMEDLVEAARQTVPLATTLSEQIDRLRRWAAGRARPAGRGREAGVDDRKRSKM